MNIRERKRYNAGMAKQYDKREDVFNPFTELCHYADEYHLVVEIEKPFPEFDQLFLKLVDADEEVVHRVTLENISYINDEAATLLNELSKTKH